MTLKSQTPDLTITLDRYQEGTKIEKQTTIRVDQKITIVFIESFW